MYGCKFCSSWLDLLPSQLYYQGVPVAFSDGKPEKMANSDNKMLLQNLCPEPNLRTTVPLVSYIRNSLRFWYDASRSTCCQNLEKNWDHRENLGESGGQTFKGCDREKCQF